MIYVLGTLFIIAVVVVFFVIAAALNPEAGEFNFYMREFEKKKRKKK